MSPPNQYIADQLRHLVYYHLDNNLPNNAAFVAGRLHAYEPRSSEASCLLALCHIRLGELKAAYDISRTSGARGSHLGCAYTFAQACLGLGRFKEGINALDRSKMQWSTRNSWNKHSESTRKALPDASAVWCLLGKLWSGYKDIKKAIDCYAQALTHNPFMWDAYIGLCDTGASIRVQNIFRANPEMLAMLSAKTPLDSRTESMTILEEPTPRPAPLQSQRSVNSSLAPSMTDPFGASNGRGQEQGTSNAGNGGLFRKFNESALANLGSIGGSRNHGREATETPTANTHTEQSARTVNHSLVPTVAEPPQAPMRRARTAQPHFETGTDGPPKMRSASVRSRGRRGDDAEASDVSTTTSQSSAHPEPSSLHGHSEPSSVHGHPERKRTVSGQVPPTNTSRSNDPNLAPQRRSDRLLNQIRPISNKWSSATGGIGSREGRELRKAKATGTKGRVGSTTASNGGRVVSVNRRPMEVMDVDAKEQRPPLPTVAVAQSEASNNNKLDISKQQEALQWILELFSKLGHGYFCLTHFHCEKALQIFGTLPTPQRETPWVLAQMGKANYEQASYKEAEENFAKLRGLAPARMEDMEVYSTVLWHLKKDVELAFLAHELMDVSRLSPQAWCAIGNSFSLQREHDQALKCFKRATQLDQNFAYAFTLQGHEHVANEEFDKAQASYRAGIRVDCRHYNSWYGLGKVYEKMGKYATAEKHYKTAAQINSRNPVLICCIGGVLEKLRQPSDAHEQYHRACELAPRSALARFKKARVLMNMQEPGLALSDLMILKDIAPEEANVHYLLGRLYKMLRQKANAIKHFTIAMNLDPKAGAYIKTAIESLEDDEDDEDFDGIS
ncbi:MAG: anaphase-promoting complex subunit cdc27 [Vezdaea acicularis]|nr:MAG: anaphase-promoting complex subunit cdc27 [Vezdaea acicularis]